MKKVRVGLIGAGFMGMAHSSCYTLDRRVELACLSSPGEDKAHTLIERYGYQDYQKDWRDVISDDSIDVVDITAPNFLHAEIALAAIQAGKKVIMEKPLATTLEDARKLVGAAQKHHVLAMYAENRLFAPVFVRTREMIGGGELGEIRIFRINEMGSGPGHAGWFRDKKKAGGGAVIDMGIHGLCLSEWLIGSRIRSLNAVTAPEGETEETAVTNCRFENGALGQFICSWGIQGGLDIRAEIFGSAGTILIDHGRDAAGMRAYRSRPPSGERENRPHQASDTGWSFPLADEWNVKGHAAELRHFVDCMLGEAECRSTFERGYRALELAMAIYESAESKAEVEV